ncbi:hypothetical protein C8Q77DRAFT_1176940 [Trametes polyzona]|nr:hypothetical protein C8Q77DRAFT_1176940 [Trametes polyzona]
MEDLSKLTVARLKALCKERKIAGYSKLGKQALIQKLVESGYSGSSSAVPDARSTVPIISETETVDTTAPPTASATSVSVPFAAEITGEIAAEVSSESTITVKAKVPAPKAKPKARKAAPATANSARRSHQLAPPASVSTIEDAPAVQVTPIYDSVLSRSLHASGSQHTAHAASNKCDGSGSGGNSVSSTAPQLSTRVSKRPQPNNQLMPPPPLKKPRIQPPEHRPPTPKGTPSSSVASPSPSMLRRPSKASDVSVAPAPSTMSALRNVLRPAQGVVTTLPPRKRFKPLVVDKSKLSPGPPRPSVGGASLSAASAVPTPSSANVALRYLEFPALSTVLPTLRSITLPPPLAQRKRVGRWAIILSGLSDAERAICVLVSRTFRYAVYLSASSILLREYRGKRLDVDVLKKYSPAMTDMWPYLRVRQAEVAERRRIYAESFLPRFFKRYGLPADPISERMWASPDNPKQIIIAVRFALTRAWFELSVGTSSGSKGDPTSWLHGTVVDAQEIVPGEIWSVTLEYPQAKRKRETLYVIEATCEVVGQPPATGGPSGAPGSLPIPVRADWSAYISHRKYSGEGSIWSHLKWSCHEEFDKGMSRHWLKRVAGEGELGCAKQTVAERYVLACVVANSVSGKWLSASEMAQDFAGLPARGAEQTSSRLKNLGVNLYLPECVRSTTIAKLSLHHHVESIHFTAPGGSSLHTALAVVQTPHRAYYVLRDNGMQVGCEEEGIGEVWRAVLGCDQRGLPV